MINILATMLFCASSDMKCTHLYVQGPGFDTMHKITDELYEMLAEDADKFAEIAMETDLPIPNPNYAAAEIDWQITVPAPKTREEAIYDIESTLTTILSFATEIFTQLVDEGDKNSVADLISRYNHQLKFLNKHRGFEQNAEIQPQ